MRLRDHVDWRDVKGEIVALDVRRSSYLTLNSTGSLLWELLAKGTTRDQLVDGIMARFNVTRDSAASDVDAFLERLRELNLIEAEGEHEG